MLKFKFCVTFVFYDLWIYIFCVFAGIKLTQRIPLIPLFHASSSLHFILCSSPHLLHQIIPNLVCFTLRDSSLILLFSALYGPSLLPYLSKYSNHDTIDRVRGGRSNAVRWFILKASMLTFKENHRNRGIYYLNTTNWPSR